MNEELLAQIERELLSWPGVRVEEGRFNSITYRVGRKEIGHIHRNGVADLPFPRATYDELIASGRAHPHHFGVRGFVSYTIDRPGGVDEAIALFRMNYDRANASAAGRNTDQETLDE